jgi:DNA-binding NarL/FixJ family response regulator
VLRALSLGKTNRGIAESLGIAEGTVAWHMKSILKKMWVANRAEAIAKANRLGLDDRS